MHLLNLIHIIIHLQREQKYEFLCCIRQRKKESSPYTLPTHPFIPKKWAVAATSRWQFDPLSRNRSKDKARMYKPRRKRESVAWRGNTDSFPSTEVCSHVNGTTNDATRMIQPHAARVCCAVVGQNKKKASHARPEEGPRPLVTFPILLGTPLPGQSCRPRRTPCASTPCSTPRQCTLFRFSMRTLSRPRRYPFDSFSFVIDISPGLDWRSQDPGFLIYYFHPPRFKISL